MKRLSLLKEKNLYGVLINQRIYCFKIKLNLFCPESIAKIQLHLQTMTKLENNFRRISALHVMSICNVYQDEQLNLTRKNHSKYKCNFCQNECGLLKHNEKQIVCIVKTKKAENVLICPHTFFVKQMLYCYTFSAKYEKYNIRVIEKLNILEILKVTLKKGILCMQNSKYNFEGEKACI